MTRQRLILLAAFTLLAAAVPAGMKAFRKPPPLPATQGPRPAVSGDDRIATDNYANKNLSYFYYIPAAVLADAASPHPLIICIPGLSGQGRAFANRPIRDFADDMGAVVIAPSFMWDEANWASQTSYQYPAAWSGNALLSIVDRVKETYGLTFSKFHLLGISAGAQFCARFALWKPDLSATCAAHAFGGEIIPGRYVPVKFLIGIGAEDIPDRKRHATVFSESGRKLGIEIELKEYSVGHDFSPEQLKDSLELFRQAIRQ
jgi:poly(3-hydroxybutyrate) depolymerase